MHTTRDIYSVSDFNRKPAEHIKRLQETKKPEVLTVNGKAAVVMVDPLSYDQLAQDAELARTLAQIVRANAEHENGQSQPLHEAFVQLKEEMVAKYLGADL